MPSRESYLVRFRRECARLSWSARTMACDVWLVGVCLFVYSSFGDAQCLILRRHWIHTLHTQGSGSRTLFRWSVCLWQRTGTAVTARQLSCGNNSRRHREELNKHGEHAFIRQARTPFVRRNKKCHNSGCACQHATSTCD